MITLYKSFMIPILEYSSVLWSPINKESIRQLESIQGYFLRKIRGINCNNYWDCLKKLKMYYVCNILENLVKNINGKVESKDHIRLGHVRINKYSSSNSHKFRYGSVTIDGPRLFNSLPMHIRDLRGVSLAKFKRALDAYLVTIADEPLLPGYTACRRTNSNSIHNMPKNSVCLVSPYL